jgi:hypothetical protein
MDGLERAWCENAKPKAKPYRLANEKGPPSRHT